jgi:Na+/proline symporter
MTLAVIAVYMAAVLGVGALSHRLFSGTGEDYFLATRSIGPFVLLMSLFGTHMTAFALLGASGESYRSGIGVFGLMASRCFCSSARAPGRWASDSVTRPRLSTCATAGAPTPSAC